MIDNYLWDSSYHTSQRLVKSNLQLGKPRLKNKVAEMIAKGIQITDLSGYIVEKPYGYIKSPPEYVFSAVKEALESGWPEPELRGIPSLRGTIAKLESRKGIDTDPDTEILVTGGGAMQGIYNVLQAILDPGDETLVFAPSLAYDEQVKLAGGRPVYVELEENSGYKLNASDIKKAITPRTKVMILNTPHNPTGHVASREELEEIAEIVKQSNLIVISDEVVWKWLYDDREHISFGSLDGMRDRTITVSSVTKSGMLDWRIGWVIATEGFIKNVEKLMFWQNQFSPPLLQVAAEAHLKGLDEWIRPIVRDQQKKRDLLYNGLISAGCRCFKPEGHLTAFPNISAFHKSSVRFSEFLLEKAHVLVSPGIAYLGEGHIRVGFNQSAERVKEGVENMGRVLRDFKSAFSHN